MKTTPDDANPHVEAAHNPAFDAEVERIAAMTGSEVESNLRQIGIEPAKTLPARLYQIIAKERHYAASAQSAPLDDEEPSHSILLPAICLLGMIAASIFILVGNTSSLSKTGVLNVTALSVALLCSFAAAIQLFKSVDGAVKYIFIPGLAGVASLLVLTNFPISLNILSSRPSETEKCCQSIVIVDTSASKYKIQIGLSSKRRTEKETFAREIERLRRERERLLKAIDSELRATESVTLSSCRSRRLQVWEAATPQPNILATYQPPDRRRTLEIMDSLTRARQRRAFLEQLAKEFNESAATKRPSSNSDISSVYAALVRATSMDSSQWRKLVVITDSRETSDPLILKSLSGTWVSGSRINNERTEIVFYDLGLSLDSQEENMQQILSGLFTHPEIISVRSEL